MVEHRQRMLGGRAGSAGGAAGSCKHMLPPKGEKPAEKYGKLLPRSLSELVKTKSLHFPASLMPSDGLSRWKSRTTPISKE